MPAGNALAIIRGVSKINFFNFDIIISNNTSSWDLSKELVLLGWDQTSPIKGTVTINSNVVINGTATTKLNKNGTSSFTVGTYDAKSQITIINKGKIIGCGGFGGSGDVTKDNSVKGANGGSGGNAMDISNKINLRNDGEIIGGGGGGGGNVGGGGGGAGNPEGNGGDGVDACMDFGNQNPCYTKVAGSAGNNQTGGNGGNVTVPSGYPSWIDDPNGGNGGNLGSKGIDSNKIRIGSFSYTGKGGSAGSSVKGWNLVTYDTNSTGTFTGPKT